MVQGVGAAGGSGSISGLNTYELYYSQYIDYLMNNPESTLGFESWLEMTGKLAYFTEQVENYIESDGQNGTNGDGKTGNNINTDRSISTGSGAIYQSSDDETFYQFDWSTGDYRVITDPNELATAIGLPEGTTVDMIEFGFRSAVFTDVTFGELDDGQDSTSYKVNSVYNGVTLVDQEFDIHYILNALLMDPTDPQYQTAKEVFDKLCDNINQWLPQSDLEMLNEIAEQYGTNSAEYKAVLQDVLLSNLDQANEWVEDHAHVANNSASLEEIGSTGATDGTEGTEGTGDGSNNGSVPEYDKSTILNNAGILADYTNNTITKTESVNLKGKSSDEAKSQALSYANQYAESILDSVISSLQSELGDQCTKEIQEYIAKAKEVTLSDTDSWRDYEYDGGLLRKKKHYTGKVKTKALIDKFFTEFNTLCANNGKSSEEIAAEQQAAEEKAAREEGVFKELYNMDMHSVASEAGADKNVQVVNVSSASEIQAKAESDILQPLMNKLKSKLQGKGLSDSEITSVLEQCADYALSYTSEWANTTNNYVYTIYADKLIDKFEEAVKSYVKNRGYDV